MAAIDKEPVHSTTDSSFDSVERRCSQAFVSAVYLLLLYMAYSLALRAFNFATLARAGGLKLNFFGPPFSLPFILGEELAIGAIFALVLFFFWANRFARAAWIAVVGLYMLFLAFNQLAFKYFFSNVDYVIYSDGHDLVALSGSIAGSLDAFFFAEIALALFFAALLFVEYRPRFVRTVASAAARRPIASALLLLAYLGCTVALAFLHDQRGFNRSFPVGFVESYLQAKEEENSDRNAAVVTQPVTKPQAAATARAAEPDAGSGSDEMARVREAIAAYTGKPNVVWYFMESVSYRETSFFPQKRYETTPFLKDLSKSSLLFTKYHSGWAASTRAFFSAMTGLYPYLKRSADIAVYSRLNVPTLVDILHDAGYQTAFFSSSDTLFDSLDSFIGSKPYDFYIDKNLVPQEELSSGAVESWGVDEEIVINHALQWIETAKESGKPFFVNYNAVFPHHPFNVPRRHKAAYDMGWGDEGLRSNYRATLRYADDAVRRFYDGLKRLNVLDDTVFVVTPDHGEAFGDLHPQNLIHAEYCYEEDSNIFLMLHNPKVLGTPLSSARRGSHADLLPTLLDILRLEPVRDVEGQSLVSERYQERLSFCCSRRQLGVRDGDLKLVTDRIGGESELYDLSNDPEEKKDISSENKDKASALKKAAHDWKSAVLMSYDKRFEAAGLTEEEIGRLAKQRRAEIFGGVGLKMADAQVCLKANPAVCASPSQPQSFKKGQALIVRTVFKKPERASVKVEVFGQGGRKLVEKENADSPGGIEIATELPASVFQEPGSYRVRVLALVSHAVHDSRSIGFEIAE